jgi:hypothetical protein
MLRDERMAQMPECANAIFDATYERVIGIFVYIHRDTETQRRRDR